MQFTPRFRLFGLLNVLMAAAEAAEAGQSSGGAAAPTGKASDAKPSKVEAEQVLMQDGTGRLVEFAGKRKLLKEDVTAEGATHAAVRFDFRNGQSRTFYVSEQLALLFEAHGASQKIGDTCAGLDSVDDMVIAVDEAIDRLYNGNWGAVREGGGLAGASILLRALGEAYPNRKPEELKKFLAGKTHAEKIALRNSERLKSIIARIEAEKAAKVGAKVDADALLAGLEGDGALESAVGAAPRAASGASPSDGDMEATADSTFADDSDASSDASSSDAEGMAHATGGPDVYGDADAGKAAESAATGGKGRKIKGAPRNTEVSEGHGG